MRSPVDYRRIEQAMARGTRDGAAAGELFAAAATVLEEIASGRRALRAVRHPLGFLCLPVRREGDRGVCVHVFGDVPAGPPARPTTSAVHAHSWDLISCVLYGQVGNLRVRVRDEPDRPTHRLFEVHSTASVTAPPDGTGDAPAVDEIRPTSRLVSCAPGPEETSLAGGIYRLPAGEFHTTVVPPGTVAATLLLGRSLPGRHDLTLGPVHGPAHRVVRQTCDAAQTARTARTVLRRIDGHHCR
ncbi:hypothetical protein [Streptomyces sp. UNOB3_S3]|uniref:hypothetical protein n=1 Tax=Streptomyces sp. UNOB3_S3 TaxID=2871682 RepID=UPI001E5ADCD6|nr:hypothetical protein [Streptomyces sp. UNOB3_S3]MCC3779733.1 hypothetical protein [Streptomyces sp. UNOB3_S3]